MDRFLSWTIVHATACLGVAAGVAGAIAALHAYKASAIQPKPVWDDNPELKPSNFQMHAFGMLRALEAAQFWAGRQSRLAAIWALIAAILAMLAVFVPT
jgi:hypothetical protein